MIYLYIIVVMILSFALPWWGLMLGGIIVGYKFSPSMSFYKITSSAFFSGLIVWGILSYFFDSRAQGLISKKMAVLIGFPHSEFMYLLSGLVAGVSLAMSTWFGREIKLLFSKGTAL